MFQTFSFMATCRVEFEKPLQYVDIGKATSLVS